MCLLDSLRNEELRREEGSIDLEFPTPDRCFMRALSKEMLMRPTTVLSEAPFIL